MKKIENLREKMIGEYGEGKSFQTTTKWVEENDSEIYDILHEKMQIFVADESNQTYEEDLDSFEEGNWIVEYVFREGDDEGNIEILITVGETIQSIANQDAWIRETVTVEELEENWEAKAYLQMFK